MELRKSVVRKQGVGEKKWSMMVSKMSLKVRLTLEEGGKSKPKEEL